MVVLSTGSLSKKTPGIWPVSLFQEEGEVLGEGKLPERLSPQLPKVLDQCFIFYFLFVLNIILNEHKVPLLPESFLHKLKNDKHRCLPRNIKL